jgi:hypothetical protein
LAELVSGSCRLRPWRSPQEEDIVKQAEYRALRSGVGAKIRAILNEAANRQPPTRSHLREAIEAAGLETIGDALISEAQTLAQRVRAGENRFHVGQHADQAAIRFTRQLVKSDSLVGDDRLPGEAYEQEVAQAHAVADRIRAGDADAGPFGDAVRAHVRATVVDKLRIANPKYLGDAT